MTIYAASSIEIVNLRHNQEENLLIRDDGIKRKPMGTIYASKQRERNVTVHQQRSSVEDERKRQSAEKRKLGADWKQAKTDADSTSKQRNRQFVERDDDETAYNKLNKNNITITVSHLFPLELLNGFTGSDEWNNCYFLAILLVLICNAHFIVIMAVAIVLVKSVKAGRGLENQQEQSERLCDTQSMDNKSREDVDEDSSRSERNSVRINNETVKPEGFCGAKSKQSPAENLRLTDSKSDYAEALTFNDVLEVLQKTLTPENKISPISEFESLDIFGSEGCIVALIAKIVNIQRPTSLMTYTNEPLLQVSAVLFDAVSKTNNGDEYSTLTNIVKLYDETKYPKNEFGIDEIKLADINNCLVADGLVSQNDDNDDVVSRYDDQIKNSKGMMSNVESDRQEREVSCSVNDTEIPNGTTQMDDFIWVVPFELNELILLRASHWMIRTRWQNDEQNSFASALTTLSSVNSFCQQTVNRSRFRRSLRRLIIVYDPFLLYTPRSTMLQTLHQDVSTYEINCAAVVGNSLYVFAISSSVMRVYNTQTLKLDKSVDVDDVCDPWALAARPQTSRANNFQESSIDRLYLFEGSNLLLRLTVEGSVEARWSVDGSQRGLSISPCGQRLLVTYRNRLEERSAQDGTVLRVIKLDREITDASHAVERPVLPNDVSMERQFAACHGGGQATVRHLVGIIGCNGKIVSRHAAVTTRRRRRRSPHRSYQPIHVTTDAGSRCLLVTDINGREIRLLNRDVSRDFRLVSVELADVFDGPIACCLDTNFGRLFIVTLSGRLMCYQVRRPRRRFLVNVSVVQQ